MHKGSTKCAAATLARLIGYRRRVLSTYLGPVFFDFFLTYLQTGDGSTSPTIGFTDCTLLLFLRVHQDPKGISARLRGWPKFSNATLQSKFCLRACIVNHRTTDDEGSAGSDQGCDVSCSDLAEATGQEYGDFCPDVAGENFS
jgi:hypothetical protein